MSIFASRKEKLVIHLLLFSVTLPSRDL